MKNKLVFDIIVVRIVGNEIHGTELSERPNSAVVIQSEDIAMIETKRLEVGDTVILVSVLLAVFASGVFIVILSQW